MKSMMGVVPVAALCAWGLCVQMQPATQVLPAEASRRGPSSRIAPAPTEPVLTYTPGSTIKLEQLIGDEDKQLRQPTLSQTVTRYGIVGTDLGNSFEHGGRVYFLFGDTMGRLDRALDVIGTTDATDPESGVRLDFLTSGSDYLTIQPPGVSMGPFEVPVAGISLADQAYVAVSTNHSEDRATDRSVLTKFTPPAAFQPLRTISQLPEGHFVKMSLHTQPGPIAGLPPGGPFVLVWGTGEYRKSDAYLSVVPVAQFETGNGTRYFAGLDGSGAPTWSEKETDARPTVQNGTMGDLSVTWCNELGAWLMTYDSRDPAPRGISVFILPHAVGTLERAADHFQCGAGWCHREIHPQPPGQSGRWACRTRNRKRSGESPGRSWWRLRAVRHRAVDQGAGLRAAPLLRAVDVEPLHRRPDEITTACRE